MSDEDFDGEYTRFRANIQLGDGIDQRGDVTVELVREPNENRNERETGIPLTDSEREHINLDGRDMEVVDTPCNDREFAEFYNELQRASNALRDALNLPDPDG